MQIRRLAVPVILFLLSPRLWALDPLPLKGAAASLHWDAPQYIQADAQGNVFLLRGDTLEVYPVTKAHDLGEPVRLELGVRSGIPLDAAISPDGSWVVNMGTQVHWFVAGKEKSLPVLRSSPVSVGFLRGDPVAMVVPRHGEAQDDDRRGPPLLLRAGHDAWSPELREVLHTTPLDPATERAYRSALVLDEREGRYFLARKYAYRIELRRLGRDHPIEEHPHSSRIAISVSTRVAPRDAIHDASSIAATRRQATGLDAESLTVPEEGVAWQQIRWDRL